MASACGAEAIHEVAAWEEEVAAAWSRAAVRAALHLVA
jgi:hypothetical protein